MMRTLAKVLLVSAAFASGNGMAYETLTPPVAVVVPDSALSPRPVIVPDLALSPRPSTGLNWQSFEIGVSEGGFLVGGADIGLGTTRPLRDTGSNTLPLGGQVLLRSPGGISITGVLSSASGGEGGLYISAVPEPAAPLMLLAGMALLAAVRRRPGR
jgi:hypothetical protein